MVHDDMPSAIHPNSCQSPISKFGLMCLLRFQKNHDAIIFLCNTFECTCAAVGWYNERLYGRLFWHLSIFRFLPLGIFRHVCLILRIKSFRQFMELPIDGCYQLPAQSQCPFAHTSLCRHEKVKVRINDTLIINSTEIRETYRECCNGSINIVPLSSEEMALSTTSFKNTGNCSYTSSGNAGNSHSSFTHLPFLHFGYLDKWIFGYLSEKHPLAQPCRRMWLW